MKEACREEGSGMRLGLWDLGNEVVLMNVCATIHSGFDEAS